MVKSLFSGKKLVQSYGHLSKLELDYTIYYTCCLADVLNGPVPSGSSVSSLLVQRCFWLPAWEMIVFGAVSGQF